jgi:hypothetical protein
MERDFLICYNKYNETFHLERSGTYKEVESWAYKQMEENGWEAFGLRDMSDLDVWASEEETA